MVKDGGVIGHALVNGNPPVPRMSPDEIWFRGLLEDCHRDLLAYAARRVGSVEDARDVASEVFAVAWRRRADLPDDLTEQRMWLYGVARHTIANHRRADQRRVRLVSRLTAIDDAVVADPAANDDPTDVATAFRALETLRPQDREILLLSLWEELTNQQIASVMGISPANVSLRLHRARTRLRKTFFRLVKDPQPPGHVTERAHGDVATESSS